MHLLPAVAEWILDVDETVKTDGTQIEDGRR